MQHSSVRPTDVLENIIDMYGNMLFRYSLLMLGNAEFVVLLQQKNSEIKQVVDLFELSPSQEMYLKTGEKGTGLIICGKKVIPFSKKIPKSRLYDIMSTNFKEKQERMRNSTTEINIKFNLSDLEKITDAAAKKGMDIVEYIVSCCNREEGI